MVHYKGCLGVTSKPIVGTHTGTTPFCGIFGDIIFGYWGCCEEQYVDPSFLETLLTEYSNITCILRHSGFGFLPSNATFLQWHIGRECHQTCSRKEEMFGWKFWHYFPRNRRDVHEIQLEVQSCKPSRMQDLRMKCLWF